MGDAPSGRQTVVLARRADASTAPARAKRRGGLSGWTIAGIVIAIGVLALLPGVLRPRSPLGMMSMAWAGTIRSATAGVGEFAHQMVTEPEANDAPMESAKGDAPPMAPASTDGVRWSGSSQRVRIDILSLEGSAGSWTILGVVTNISAEPVTDISLSLFVPSNSQGDIYAFPADGGETKTLAPGEGIEIEMFIPDPSSSPQLTLTFSWPSDPDVAIKLWDETNTQ